MDQPGSEPQPFLTGEFSAHSPEFSPDGRFIAYVSNESGGEEIYVTEFTLTSPDARAREKISRSGGWEPAWSRDGTELYFRSYEGTRLMVVSIRTASSLQIGEPKELLDISRMPAPIPYGDGSYDVAPDGRFLMVMEDESRDRPMYLVVVLNWLDDLNRLAPPEN